jgi:hypothetical protein
MSEELFDATVFDLENHPFFSLFFSLGGGVASLGEGALGADGV